MLATLPTLSTERLIEIQARHCGLLDAKLAGDRARGGRHVAD